MSAFFALALADRVELLTDGAVYDDDGTLTAIRRKVWTSNRLPLAVTGRGNWSTVKTFAVAAVMSASIGTFDEAVERFDGVLRRRAGRGSPEDFELVIVGISESRGPAIFYASSIDMYGAGLEPWRLHDAGNALGGGILVDFDDIDLSDGLRRDGVELFERMRAVPGPNPVKPDLPEIHGIGGHVDLTTVRADGCTVERLHTWPDTVGEKIVPERVAA